MNIHYIRTGASLDSDTELRRIFNVNSNLTTMPCAQDAWHFITSKFYN